MVTVGEKMMCRKTVITTALSVALLFLSSTTNAKLENRGIYINQGTLENTKTLQYLIDQSKAVGINTFVIDLQKATPNYQKNVALVKSNGIKYVARIVVFPDGGKPSQIKSTSYWEGKFKLVESAIRYGADEIQLDYIRYSTKQPASAQNAKDIKEVLRWFKKNMASYKVPLQVDIFGEVSFKESPRIGQNIQLFADTIDVACPMVYPSHYHPYESHSKQPYETVYKSLQALKKQFNDSNLPFKLTPFIEASNYHYKWSAAQRSTYVLSQIRAVEDANVDGWYVWSPKNHYDSLFEALKNRKNLVKKTTPEAIH